MSVDTLIRVDERANRLSWVSKLALTLAFLLVISLLRWWFREWLTLLPFLPYFPVVVVCAVLFGTGYAYVASVLGFIISLYFFVPSELTFLVKGEALIASLLFLLVLLFTGWSVGTLRTFSVRLYAAERAKAVLLRELNHRCKNNLQMVSSLLTIEGARVSDPMARKAFDDAISRIAVMGQMHTLLYQRDAAEAVDVQEFVERLCTGLHASFVGERPIAIHCRAESLQLDMDKAVLVGIIVNEAVTNALRHAFTDARAGTVDVHLSIEEGRALLRVDDNGVGIVPVPSKGLGSRLIDMMASQLGGTAVICPLEVGGTEVLVTIPLAQSSSASRKISP